MTRDIICFANDWFADPLSKKHVITRLARNSRVLWVNSINVRRPQLAQKDARRIAQKLKGFTRGLQQVDQHIWVLTPIFLPFHGGGLARSLNRWMLGLQIRRAARSLGFERPMTFACVPTAADVVGTLGEALTVYYCVDEYGAFSDAASEVALRERELCRKADVVIASSAALVESKSRYNPRTYLVTHGVDYEHFRRAADASGPVADEIATLPRPVLGFHGLIADWVDVTAIAEIARQRLNWSIVLVGRVDTDTSGLAGLANVHFLGHRPYSRLPEYLRGFDVALLPFVYNELTINANPLKLREYLAAGLPVVSAPLPEVLRFGDLVKTARTGAEYVEQIEAILRNGQTGPSRERSALMANETWDHKVEQIVELVQRCRPGPARQK